MRLINQSFGIISMFNVFAIIYKEGGIRVVKMAENRICVCDKEESNIIYTDTVEGPETQFGVLDGFYCKVCNSFWREP